MDERWDAGAVWEAPGGAVGLRGAEGNDVSVYEKGSLVETSRSMSVYQTKNRFWKVAHDWLKDEYGLENNNDLFVIDGGLIYVKPLPSITSLEII